MIDKHSSLPLYAQVERYLITEMSHGGYQTGDVVPSERELAEKFQISRMTVRQAINNLVFKGFLYREKGKGTFVSAPKIAYHLKGLASFSEDMKRRGLKPSTRLVSFETLEEAPDYVNRNLDIIPGKKVIRLDRTRFANEQPVATECAYLPYELFASLTEKDTEVSLYQFVREKLNSDIYRADQQIEASLANESEGKRLNIDPGSPILIVNRITYLRTGEPFETVKTVYRGDKYSFSVEMYQE